MAFSPSSFPGAFDSDDRGSYFSGAVSPAVTQTNHAASDQQLPHERLRKKLFGSKWQYPSLHDTFWLCNHFKEASTHDSGTLTGSALIQALRKLEQLEGLREEV